MKRSIDADLELVLDDGSIWVHAAILTIGSDVFRSMLSSGYTEETNWKITLPGKDCNTFQLFYNMLHCETAAKINELNVWRIAELANEYQTLKLLSLAQSWIWKNVNENRNQIALTYAHSKRLGFTNMQKKVEGLLDGEWCVSDFFFDDFVYGALDKEIPKSLWVNIHRICTNIPLKDVHGKCMKDFIKEHNPKDKYQCKALLKFVIDFQASYKTSSVQYGGDLSRLLGKCIPSRSSETQL
jgi:hypothetical protein